MKYKKFGSFIFPYTNFDDQLRKADTLSSQQNYTNLVLVILLLLELELLDVTLGLLVSFVGITSAALNTSEFEFKLTDARLQLSHGIAAALVKSEDISGPKSKTVVSLVLLGRYIYNVRLSI